MYTPNTGHVSLLHTSLTLQKFSFFFFFLILVSCHNAVNSYVTWNTQGCLYKQYLPFVLTLGWITLISLIPFFFFPPESPENIFLGTQQLKSAWGLWPGMPLHAVIFRHLMALPSSLTCSVLTGTHSLLSAKNLQKPTKTKSVLPFLLYWIRGAFLHPQFNPSRVDVVKWKWAVLPLRTWLWVEGGSRAEAPRCCFLPKNSALLLAYLFWFSPTVAFFKIKPNKLSML